MRKLKSERERLRLLWQEYWQGFRDHTESPSWPNNGDYRGKPAELEGMTCGAKTRAGTPCKRIDLFWSGRCKFHGGHSTGPKSPLGKANSAQNGRLGGRPPRVRPVPKLLIVCCKSVSLEAPAEAGKTKPHEDGKVTPRFLPAHELQQVAPGKKLSWREYAEKRGLKVQSQPVQAPVKNTMRVHLIPAPSRKK